MLPTFGRDRCRVTAERVVLLSAIPKGWTARTPATGTHAEYPGTTVAWDGQMYEVVEAHASGTSVRYVLLPWREDHVIRTLEHYDAEAEQRRLDDFERAQRQRRASVASRISGVFLGHLPEPVQNRLQNELGVSPARMTILSCVPSLILLAICVFDQVDATIRGEAPRIPIVVTFVAAFLVVESYVRFHTAMSQSRGIGSILGALAYTVYWAFSRKRATLASPFGERGTATFTLPPDDAVAFDDRVQFAGAFLTLLPAGEQEMLARRTRYEYRAHASGLALGMLFFAVLGVVSMWDDAGDRLMPTISFIAALAVAIEQIVRLLQLRTRPAPSFLRFLVWPFVRGLVEEVRRMPDPQPLVPETTARN